jgi:gamma-glutamyl-gamma-aminobutyrate hydrolase PuuD
VSTGRPRIGIVARRATVRLGAWDDLACTLVTDGYIDSVVDAGGEPLLIPLSRRLIEGPHVSIQQLDALVLPGGPDVSPELYGAVPHPRTVGSCLTRDVQELSLLRGALALDLPVLGICRGAQLLNVAHGGTLDQHLGDSGRGDLHLPTPGTFGSHAVLPTGGQMRRLLPAEFEVRSHHHQGIGLLGTGLVATAHAPDGVVEAWEAPARAFCLGVLWHPEEQSDAVAAALFGALVSAAHAELAQSFSSGA